MKTDKSPALGSLFTPSSVAVIGASKSTQKTGGRFLKSLIDHGFKGRILPVNPNETVIMGLKTYPTVLDIPGDIDLAIMTIPAKGIPQAMTECTMKGVMFAIVYTAGFGETGTEGKAMENTLLTIVRDGGIRMVGPNCMGVYCPTAGLNTVVANVDLPSDSGGVAFLGQSGWASESMIVSGSDRGLRFSKVISIGNQIDLNINDYLEYFGNDSSTRVIGAYIEGIVDGKRFLRIVREVSQEKPVIIWKAGSTSAGARAVTSHTGSIAGSDLICNAAFKQAGAIRAQNLDDVVDFAVAFTSPYLPQGKRLGVIEQSGGGGIATADSCESYGLELPQLPRETQQELKESLDGVAASFSSVRNPVDLISLPRTEDSRVLPRCLEIMAGAVDALILFTYHPLTDETLARSIKEARDRIQKPVFVVPPYPSRELEGISLFTQMSIPAFPSAERATRALAVLHQYATKTCGKD